MAQSTEDGVAGKAAGTPVGLSESGNSSDANADKPKKTTEDDVAGKAAGTPVGLSESSNSSDAMEGSDKDIETLAHKAKPTKP